MFAKSLLALVTLAASVSAHTIFQQITVNGSSPGRLKGVRYPSFNGPIENVSLGAMACNGADGPNPLVTPYDTTVIDVPVGSTVTAQWYHNLNGYDPSNPDDPIGTSHKGPVTVYLAKVDSALQASTAGLQWFKIHHDGYDPATGVWAVDKLIARDGAHDFTIPTCLKNGHYFMRVEIIALHAAGNYPGAQFYMGCAQVNITGGSGTANPATVSFPGAYSGTDPGVKVSIYYPPLTASNPYIIPGPAPFTCGSTPPPSSTSTSRPPSSTSRPVSSTTTTTRPPSSSSSSTSRPPSSSSRPSSSSATGAGSPLYGQCGGQNWAGPFTCAQGTCTKLNDFYSQCVP